MVELKRMDWSDFMLVCEGCNCSAVRSMSFYMGVQDYCQCSRPISLILGVVIVSTNQKNLLTFGSDIWFRITYFLPIAEWGILADLLAFLIPVDFHDTGERTR